MDASHPSKADLFAGTTLGRYRVEVLLGSGGMGEVYRAHDNLLERDVALKRLFAKSVPDAPRVRDSLLAEARAATALSHPAVVAIYDVFDHDGETFIVQELVPGASLDTALGSPFPLEQFFNISAQCAGALAAAEKAGVVHCDLKPANIMIAEGSVRILDFGIARRKRAPGTAERGAGGTEDETLAGTPAYIAPEVFRGEAPSPASDIFSLGVISYEMLTGRHPFRRGDLVKTMLAVVEEIPSPPGRDRPDIRPSLDEVIGRMLAKDPTDRFVHAADLARALDDSRRDHEQSSGLRSAGGTSGGTVRDRARIPHLLVRRFESHSADAESVAFSLGLGESVQARLSGAAGIHVLAPASDLPANVLLEGSVQRSAERVRIRFAIHDHDRGLTVGGDVVEGEPSDLFALEDRVIASIGALLTREFAVELPPEGSARPTRDASAYDYYLQARGRMSEFMEKDNLNAAITLLRKALERDPRFPLALAGLAEACWRRYEISHEARWAREAERAALAALEADSEAPEVHAALGRVYFGTGRAEAASRAFRRALELDPRSDAALRGLARAEEASGRLNEAEQAFITSIANRPEESTGHHQLGTFYFRQGRAHDALREFRRVIELSPVNHLAYSNLGGVYQSLGRAGDAAEAFERSLHIQPNHRAYSNLATVYRSEGRYPEAAEMYERALAIDAMDYRVWGSLTATYYHIPGKEELARKSLERAAHLAEDTLAINPNDAMAAAALALYRADLGQPDEARRLAERAIVLASSDAQVLFHASCVFESLGDRERALQVAREALRAGCPVESYRNEPELADLVADPRFPHHFEKEVI